MAVGVQQAARESFGAKVLRWINLRPGEVERTFLMFAFYALTSVGVLWLEASAVGLFLEHYSANNLPYIYISSTVISFFLGIIYNWLQKIIPLRWVICGIAFLMAAPLPLFLGGLDLPKEAAIGVFSIFNASILLMRLWLQAVYVLNDLNTTITANQLFNIREIKRTYPLISSGVLVADVISGFLLPYMLNRLPLVLGLERKMGLSIIISVAFLMMVLGGFILLYLIQRQSRYFPTNRRRRDTKATDVAAQQLRGQAMSYRWLLLLFFVLAEAMFIFVDFQFLSQVELWSSQVQSTGVSQSQEIAGFIGIFQGVLGIFELLMQWSASSRLLESMGVFRTISILPFLVLAFGSILAAFPYLPTFSSQAMIAFGVLICLKFLYELFHFTLFASVSPVLFQPIPSRWRNDIQAGVRGTAEPIATGVTGLFLLASVQLGWQTSLGKYWVSALFSLMLVLACLWLLSTWRIHGDYVQILVLSARQDQLSGTTDQAALKELKRAAIEALSKPGMADARLACMELLIQIDRKSAAEILAPMLMQLTPNEQCRVLKMMQEYPQPDQLLTARRLIDFSKPPEVVAAALRYVFLTDPQRDLRELSSYIQPKAPPMIRGAAAALLLELGNPKDKAEATNVLRLMLTHRDEQERMMGCKSLLNLKFLQALQIYVSDIVKREKSLQVRKVVLQVIAATHFEKCYPSLVKGLHHTETRPAAIEALTQLENEALPSLKPLVEDWRQPEAVRTAAWSIIGQIATPEALEILVSRLVTCWGEDRTSILRSLIKTPRDAGIQIAFDRLGRVGFEMLIEQELMIIGQTSAVILDTAGQVKDGKGEEMLRRALHDVQTDCLDRLFLLMQFLYEPEAIQAAAFNLKSGSSDSMAQGLEILDNKVDIVHKRALLTIFERSVPQSEEVGGFQVRRNSARLSRQERMELEVQMQSLAGLITYESLTPSARMTYLMDLRHFLSDWVVTCGFHLARAEQWELARHHVLGGLRSRNAYLREASLIYLKEIYPAAFTNVLPRMQHDPDPLVRSQVHQMMKQTGITPQSRSQTQAEDDDMPNTALMFDPK
ncbi:MAG: Npt1/Npt2 family nucleotide transporter [Synechococcales bacterium]|nr:Npt1/Npt2 family nucleotide transporter [Synechococcales bacterium]